MCLFDSKYVHYIMFHIEFFVLTFRVGFFFDYNNGLYWSIIVHHTFLSVILALKLVGDIPMDQTPSLD